MPERECSDCSYLWEGNCCLSKDELTVKLKKKQVELGEVKENG